MQFGYSPYALLPFFALLISLLLLKYSWKFRSERLGRYFIFLISALAWWSMSVVMEYLSLNLGAKIFWMKISYLGIASIPIGWLAFTLTYSNQTRWLKIRIFILLAILPVITLIVVYTDSLFHLMWKDIWLDTNISPPVDAVTHNVWFWINAFYSYLLILLGVICLIITHQKSSGIFRRQTGILLVAMLAPWVANFLYIAGVKPFNIVDPTPIAFTITGIAFYWGLSRLNLLDNMPIGYESMLKSMVDGIIVLDTHKRIIELNPSAQRIIDRKESDILGQPYKQVLPIQIGFLELKPDSNETQAMIAFGLGETLRYYRVIISPIKTRDILSGYMILLHDDTERIQAEVASRERVAIETELSERRLASEEIQRRLEYEETVARISSRFVGLSDIDKAVEDSLADICDLCKTSRACLFLLTEDGKCMNETHEWCSGGVNSKGGNADSLPLSVFSWWQQKLNNGEAISILDVSKMLPEAETEKEVLQSQGIKSVLALPIFIKGRLNGFIDLDNVEKTVGWTDNDITILKVTSEIIGSAFERKRAADELAKLNEELISINTLLETKVEERTKQLEEAVATARASDKAKSEFLASMSHELRTPLNAIIGFSQVLQERYFGNLNEKQTEYVTDIIDSGKHLLSLINDILDLSKIEAGKMELEISNIRIDEIVRNSLIMIKEKALVHGISLDLEIAENISANKISGDERRLKQVMFNLLSNATKFTPDKGKIRVEAHRTENEIVISVSDNGIGMTAQEQKRLFEAFYQASGGLKDKTPGTGLGLAITKSIVEKHGGRIWVESEGTNKGCKFTFTLPVVDTGGTIPVNGSYSVASS
jgi:signal transduction histidine kinase/PAS domain-containing protein